MAVAAAAAAAVAAAAVAAAAASVAAASVAAVARQEGRRSWLRVRGRKRGGEAQKG